MAFIAIKYSEIPVFLHAGEFYRSLSTDDPENTVCIPADCFAGGEHNDPNINDVCQLLRVAMFWMLDAIPQSVLHFCHLHAPSDWQDAIAALPGAIESRILPDLLTAYTNKTSVIPFVAVIKIGRWELIEHTIRRLNRKCRATTAAAEAGDVRVLKYLTEKGFVKHPSTCTIASKFGHVECLQYAHLEGFSWGEDSNVCTYAARNGHLDCLQYAIQQGALCDAKTVFMAAGWGQLECLKYVLEHVNVRDTRVTLLAARIGQVEALQLLQQYDLELFTADTCAAAAMGEKAACLQFLHESGCPWSEMTIRRAIKYRRMDALRYAVQHGCPHSRGALMVAVRRGHMDSAEYLLQHRHYPLHERMFETALLKGYLSFLQMLLRYGCPVQHGQFVTVLSHRMYGGRHTAENSQIAQCVQYALEFGWIPHHSFVSYLVAEELHPIVAMCDMRLQLINNTISTAPATSSTVTLHQPTVSDIESVDILVHLPESLPPLTTVETVSQVSTMYHRCVDNILERAFLLCKSCCIRLCSALIVGGVLTLLAFLAIGNGKRRS